VNTASEGGGAGKLDPAKAGRKKKFGGIQKAAFGGRTKRTGGKKGKAAKRVLEHCFWKKSKKRGEDITKTQGCRLVGVVDLIEKAADWSSFSECGRNLRGKERKEIGEK